MTTILLADVAKGVGGTLINGLAPLSRSGSSVATAGDFNGDGFDDLLIGAPSAASSTTSPGTVMLVFGRAGGLGSQVFPGPLERGEGGLLIRGEINGNRTGVAVSTLGDFNGDGYSDLIIGASSAAGATSADAIAGRAYVVLGSATGQATSIELSRVAAGQGGLAVRGEGNSHNLGLRVAAGDVNGDGLADALFVAPAAPGGSADERSAGRAYGLHGLASLPASPLEAAALASGRGGFAIVGERADDGLGRSIAGAGDINGDGIDDFLIGAQSHDSIFVGKGRGETYVVYGRTGGLSGAIDLSRIAAGDGGFVIHGERTGDQSGASVATGGDFNGDGIADLVIGAPEGADPTNPNQNPGKAYVVFGRSQGFGAELELSRIAAGEGGFVAYASGFSLRTGTSVASAGDVNGDGIDDIAIGARWADGANNATGDAGRTYVLFGRPDAFESKVDLNGLASGGRGLVIHGEARSHESGTSVASAGDVDGDGFADLIIGAPNAPLTITSTGAGGLSTTITLNEVGAAYLVLGGDFSTAVTALGGSGDQLLQGTAGHDAIVGGTGADRLDGGAGGVDAFSGGQGDDTIVVRDAGFRRVDGGSGTDTLVLAGEGMTLDLSAIADLRIQGIESFDLSGNGRQTLRLTAREVLRLSDTSNAVRVRADAADLVEITDGGAWTFSAGALRAGNAVLQVDTGIGVSLVGGAAADTLSGTGGADRLRGAGGNDAIDGGAGIDTAWFDGPVSRYSVRLVDGSWSVTDNAGAEGRDALRSVERVRFADQGLALDLDGHAGSAARILGLTFGATAVANRPLVGVVLELLDGGVTDLALMQLALDVRLGAAARNDDVVTLLFNNLINRPPTPDELAIFVSMLDSGVATPAALALAAASTSLAADLVGLPALAQTGLGFS